ncbi:MAG TPA: ScyD/ScyE family protein [Gaiellaceae bacterium]|nr:ScyD/ScyE family protein [Gaiellaceae bacterium]
MFLRKISVLTLIVGLCGAVFGSVAPALAAPTVTITPVLGGLAAPRGIAFDGQGSMYLSQSGLAGAGPAGMTHTGLVNKYLWGQTTPAWSVGFNSLYSTEDPSAPPDVLGPEGISAVGNGCMKQSKGQRNGCQVQMITSESTPGILAATGGAVNDPQAGHLFRLDGASGAVTDLADVGSQQYAFTGANVDLFPDDFPDSNPYGVLVTRDPGTDTIRTYVADAGANTISEVMPDGTTRIIAYIPNETGLPFRDATPTCIAQGPDGFLYVGTLHFVANLFVFGGDQSDVWRVNPNANYPDAPQLWASGLTTVTSCTFDRAGNFWATEMFQGGLGATPPGDVVTIPFSNPSQHTRIGFGQLPVPGGIAQGPDGAMYVTVGSSAPGASGGVMRVAVN